jgi:DNA-binding HxlR family transcriptional regulator
MSKRRYRQACALAQADDLIGERWSLLLIRDLLVSPRRFKDLQNSLKGMGSNLLAARLRELEAAGIIEKRAAKGAGHVYALSEAGKGLEPALLALIRWGLAYGPSGRKGDHHRDDWDLLALKALFQPQRAGDLAVTVQFETDDFLGWIAIDKGRVAIGLGDADDPDVMIAGTINELFGGSRSPDELLAAESSVKLAQFMDAFVMPAEG